MILKQDIYKLTTEAVVIIVSILLAFAIQAWWDETQEQEAADRLLLSVLQEQRANHAALEIDFHYRQAVKESILLLTSLVGSKEVSEAEVDRLISDITWFNGPRLVWGALVSLIDGGQLALVESNELRTLLSDIHRYKSKFEQLIIAEQEDLNLRIVPFLTKNALLPQIENASRGLPGIEDSTYELENFELPINRKHSDLLTNTEFLGIVYWKLGHMTDAEFWNRKYADDSLRLIRMLEEHIEQM